MGFNYQASNLAAKNAKKVIKMKLQVPMMILSAFLMMNLNVVLANPMPQDPEYNPPDFGNCVCSGASDTRIIGGETFTGIGSPDCLTQDSNEQYWCYVNQGLCDDEVRTQRSGRYYSFDACLHQAQRGTFVAYKVVAPAK